MSPFLVTTVITFILCIFFAALAIQASWGGGYSVSLGGVQLFTLRRPPRWVVFIALTAIIAVLALLAYRAWPLVTVEPDDIFGRVQAGALVFGVLAGATLSVLVRRVILDTTVHTFDAQAKLALGLLVVFFAFGIAGEEALRSFARNLTNAKLSATGFEFTLADAGRAARVGYEGSPALGSLQALSLGAGLPPSASNGLEHFAKLAGTIGKDNRIAAAVLKAEDPKTTFDLKKDLPGDTKDAAAAADLMSPFAQCLRSTFKVSGDYRLVERFALDVSHLMRSLASPHFNDTDFPSKAAAAYVHTAGELFASQWAMALKRGNSTLGKACEDLAYQLCGGEGLPDPAIRVDNWIGPHGVRLDACVRAGLNTSASPRLRAHAEEVSKAIRAILYPPNAAGRPSHDERPYFRIAHASLLAHLGDADAALATLANWIDLQPTRAPAKAGTIDHALARWQMVRARAMFNAFSEEQIRRRGAATAVTVRTEHLRNLEQLLSDLRALEVTQALIRQTGSLSYDIASEGFTKSPEEDLASCKLDSEEAAIPLFTYVQNKMNFVANALIHSRYDESYRPRVTTFMGELLAMSLSCASGTPNHGPDRLLMRSEILDLYAQSQLRTLKPAMEELEQRRVLKRSAAAIDLGLSMTARARQGDPRGEGNGEAGRQTYVERIAVPRPTEVEESLKRTREAIRLSYRELR